MYCVDLNSDLGESFGNYTIGMDEEILKYVSSANVACGWHAGDAVVMEKTVAMAGEFNTDVGAHPGDSSQTVIAEAADGEVVERVAGENAAGDAGGGEGIRKISARSTDGLYPKPWDPASACEAARSNV